MSRPQGHGTARRKYVTEKSVPGINPGTVRLVAQRHNHYAAPGLRELRKLRNLQTIGKFPYGKFVFSSNVINVN
jgi:hypothetical protein